MKSKGRCASLGLTGVILIVAGIVVIPVLVDALLTYIVLQITAICTCSPLYKSWKEPSNSIPLYQAYYFLQIENPDQVLKGATPILTEKGPYTYNLTMFRNAESWNLNNTVTYTQPISYQFVRNMSVTSEDEVVTTMNFPFIAAASSTKYNNSFIQRAIAAIATQTETTLFLNLTVKEILWGYYDPFLHLAQKIVGKKMIPDDHFGFLMGRNGTTNGLYTTFTGVGNQSRLANIEYWNGTDKLDYWYTKWANMINGTDGTMFHPFVDKSETLYIFNPDTCRSMPYTFKEDTSYLGIPLLKYYVSPDVYANTTIYPPNEEFCQSHCSFSGVFNISQCSRGAPMGLSNPHFLYGSKELQESVIGLKPNVSLHENNFQLEPVMGLPYLFAERLQINMFIESIPNIEQTGNVKGFYYPFLWFEQAVTVRTEDAMKYKNSVLRMNKVVLWLKIILPIIGGALILIPGMMLARELTRPPPPKGSETKTSWMRASYASDMEGRNAEDEKTNRKSRPVNGINADENSGAESTAEDERRPLLEDC